MLIDIVSFCADLITKIESALTWNEESLTPDDEDGLHRAELRDTEPAALDDGAAELDQEDCAEGADANGRCDVRRVWEPIHVRNRLQVHGGTAGHNDEREAEAGCNHGDTDRQDHEPEALGRIDCCCGNANLEDEACFNDNKDQKREHIRCNGDPVCSSRNSREVECKVSIWMVEGSCVVACPQGRADDIQWQSQSIEDEDSRTTLIRVSKQDKYEEQRCRCTDLCSQVDGVADAVVDVVLKVAHRERYRPVGAVHGHVLVQVLGVRHCCRCHCFLFVL